MTAGRLAARAAVVLGALAAAVLAAGPSSAAPPKVPPQDCGPVYLTMIGPEVVRPPDAATWTAGQIAGTGRVLEVVTDEPPASARVVFWLGWHESAGPDDRNVKLTTFAPATGRADLVASADLAVGAGAVAESKQRAAVAAWWRSALPFCTPGQSPAPTPAGPSTAPTTAAPAPSASARPAAGADDGHVPPPLPDLAGVNPGDPAPRAPAAVGPGGIVLTGDVDQAAGRPNLAARWWSVSTSWLPWRRIGWGGMFLVAFVVFAAVNIWSAGGRSWGAAGREWVSPWVATRTPDLPEPGAGRGYRGGRGYYDRDPYDHGPYDHGGYYDGPDGWGPR